jgi:AcrR family transcriptional regulator
VPAAKAANKQTRATATLPSRRSAEEGAETTSDRIVDAAARCFARWGMARTRMEDVAAEIGMARPHLYRHFASKDALIHAVILRGLRHHHGELSARFPLEGPADAIILGSLVSGLLETGDYIYTGPIVEGAKITAEQLATSEEILAELRSYWVPVLEYADSRDELRAGIDISEAARWLTLMQFRWVALPALVPNRRDLERELRAFVLPALCPPKRGRSGRS